MNYDLAAARLLWWRSIQSLGRRTRGTGLVVSPHVVIPTLVLLAIPATAAGTFWPGLLALVILGAAVTTGESIVGEPFIRQVLAGPASRVSVVLGLVAGGASVAALQGALFVLLVGLLGFELSAAHIPSVAVAILCAAVFAAALSVAVGWGLQRRSAYRWRLSVLVPLWVVSGALGPELLARIETLRFNPLAMVVRALRDSMVGQGWNEGMVWLAGVAAAVLAVAAWIGTRYDWPPSLERSS